MTTWVDAGRLRWDRSSFAWEGLYRLALRTSISCRVAGSLPVSAWVSCGNHVEDYGRLRVVGFLAMIVPLYQAELAHPSIRGRITALQQFMLGVGALVASWVSYGTYVDMANDNSGQWRIPLGLPILPALFLGALIMLFPESWRWLIDHGRADAGLYMIAKLQAHGDVDNAWVRAEYEQIQEAITFEHEHEAKSYLELFQSRFLLPASRLVLRLASVDPNDGCVCYSVLECHHLWQDCGSVPRTC